MLRYVLVDDQGSDIVLTRSLFESAFPEDERPSFDLMMAWDHSGFYGVYRDEEFVGLVDVLEYKDIVYLFFLAVVEEKRNQGIGQEILSYIKTRYAGKRLFLLCDEVGEQYPDLEIRKRRMGFYEHNGFHYNGIRVREYGVIYQMMVYAGPISVEDFVSVMASLIGEDAAKEFYKDVKVD